MTIIPNFVMNQITFDGVVYLEKAEVIKWLFATANVNPHLSYFLHAQARAISTAKVKE